MAETNENKKEEYTFEDLGSPNIVDAGGKTPTPSPGNIKIISQLQNTKKLVIAGAVVLLLGIISYNLIQMYSNPASKDLNKTDLVTKPTVGAANKIPNIATVLPSVPSQNIPETKNIATENVIAKAADDSLIKQQELLKEEVTQLNLLVNELKKNITGLELKISDLDDGQSKLNGSVKKIEQNEQLKYAKTAKIGSQQLKEEKPYYIKAIIPGRVWLIDEKGTTITLKPGDVFKGYGKVKHIDPEYGKVVMEQGHIFEFHPEDR